MEKIFEREAATQITDMVGYSLLTATMSPSDIRDFIIKYHRKLKALICNLESDVEFTPMAGDSSVSIYPLDENNPESITRPLHAAIRVAEASEAGELLPTRLGIYSGSILKAEFDEHTLSFGNTFAAAARLEQLCNYFRTQLLIDRKISESDPALTKYMVSVGKITPKNFIHPIHVYTVYKPGLHGCPNDISEDHLMEFISIKNQAMDYFSGHGLKGIECDFFQARNLLLKANNLYRKLTGLDDLPTKRILDYIDQFPSPDDDFHKCGMHITAASFSNSGIAGHSLPEKLLKAIGYDVYKYLHDDDEWKDLFQLEWRKPGEKIIEAGEEPDSIFYIESGSVMVKDDNNEVIGNLGKGEVFAEMTFFSNSIKRNAHVIALTDLVVRKISGDNFRKYPELQRVFSDLTERRIRPPME
ncbi:MAG: hypothetical protein CMP91_13630 [Gammaproteobacteria bacterium]|mgnify:FL=1|nr:hypothetical protein [Gammaproteobacteria bacterium]|tara:strand:+ start:3417 stop:4661 length:1245 start_codon:yes stop_codon:yes gene_type:complete